MYKGGISTKPGRRLECLSLSQKHLRLLLFHLLWNETTAFAVLLQVSFGLKPMKFAYHASKSHLNDVFELTFGQNVGTKAAGALENNFTSLFEKVKVTRLFDLFEEDGDKGDKDLFLIELVRLGGDWTGLDGDDRTWVRECDGKGAGSWRSVDHCGGFG